jgi:hypothetical protein
MPRSENLKNLGKRLSLPKVSVCIPTYNFGNFLSHAIDSVLNQTFTDYELIQLTLGLLKILISASKNLRANMYIYFMQMM